MRAYFQNNRITLKEGQGSKNNTSTTIASLRVNSLFKNQSGYRQQLPEKCLTKPSAISKAGWFLKSKQSWLLLRGTRLEAQCHQFYSDMSLWSQFMELIIIRGISYWNAYRQYYIPSSDIQEKTWFSFIWTPFYIRIRTDDPTLCCS